MSGKITYAIQGGRVKKTKPKTRPAHGNRIPIISFFTGGGFLDMGFEQAGFDIAWTNEVNPVFAKMYAYGMSRWRQSIDSNADGIEISNTKDIQQLSVAAVLSEAFPEGRPVFFGILGGPPCQDFSSAGKHQGGDGKHGRLTETYVNRICSIMPLFFVLENVAGLFRTHAHREFLRKLEEKLEGEGYCLDLKVLNALEMGVPQDRERLFMIGIQKDFAERCAKREITRDERDWFPWPHIPQYRNARAKYKWPGVSRFGATPKKPREIPCELTVDSVLNSHTHPERQPNGTDGFRPYSGKFSTVHEGDTQRKSFKRLHRYRYSPTVCYGHNEVHLHPWEERRLTVREAMRIQGIPDQYGLPPEMPLSRKFALVANGVPVPLAYHLAAKLKEFLDLGLKATSGKRQIRLAGIRNGAAARSGTGRRLLYDCAIQGEEEGRVTNFRLLTEMQLDTDSIQMLAHVSRYRAKRIYGELRERCPCSHYGYVKASPLEVYEVMRRVRR